MSTNGKKTEDPRNNCWNKYQLMPRHKGTKITMVQIKANDLTLSRGSGLTMIFNHRFSLLATKFPQPWKWQNHRFSQRFPKKCPMNNLCNLKKSCSRGPNFKLKRSQSYPAPKNDPKGPSLWWSGITNWKLAKKGKYFTATSMRLAVTFI